MADPENFGGGDFKHKTLSLKFKAQDLKNSDVFTEIRTFFRPKSGALQKKKKKVFTEIETNFSAEIVRFRLVAGMHPELETDFSK